MVNYTITKGKDYISISGEDQYFTDEDIKDLWDNHNILYLKSGIMAAWVEYRPNNNPLIHLMEEDDGHIYWERGKNTPIQSYWLDNYIDTLTELKNKLIQRGV